MKTLEQWTAASWGDVGMVILSAVVVYAAILTYTRLTGLRSFSKMSAADFAMTVAVGSLFGSTISSPSPTLAMGATALASLFAGQWLLAWLRTRFRSFSKVVDNEPLILMTGDGIIEENLRRANVTRADIFAKLREANAYTYDQVLAVIFETTGDISVLHSQQHDSAIDPDFLQDVIGRDLLLSRQRSSGKGSVVR